jgi:hypothetical protein
LVARISSVYTVLDAHEPLLIFADAPRLPIPVILPGVRGLFLHVLAPEVVANAQIVESLLMSDPKRATAASHGGRQQAAPEAPSRTLQVRGAFAG